MKVLLRFINPLYNSSFKIGTFMYNTCLITAQQLAQRVRDMLNHIKLYTFKMENVLTYKTFFKLTHTYNPARAYTR